MCDIFGNGKWSTNEVTMLHVDYGWQLARIPRNCTGRATLGTLASIGAVLKSYDRKDHALVVAVPFTQMGLGVGQKLVDAGVRHGNVDGRSGEAVFTNGLVRLLSSKVTMQINSPLIEGGMVEIVFAEAA